MSRDGKKNKEVNNCAILISGFLVTPELSGCSFGYVTHTDPRGRLPTWVSNKERVTFH